MASEMRTLRSNVPVIVITFNLKRSEDLAIEHWHNLLTIVKEASLSHALNEFLTNLTWHLNMLDEGIDFLRNDLFDSFLFYFDHISLPYRRSTSEINALTNYCKKITLEHFNIALAGKDEAEEVQLASVECVENTSAKITMYITNTGSLHKWQWENHLIKICRWSTLRNFGAFPA